jgi:hypothetical protein
MLGAGLYIVYRLERMRRQLEIHKNLAVYTGTVFETVRDSLEIIGEYIDQQEQKDVDEIFEEIVDEDLKDLEEPDGL